MEDAVVRAVEAADSVWPVVAIFLVGIYLLLWKFGGELLKNSRESKTLAQDSNNEAKKISKYIVTNHGSTSLGNAIDRLTEWALEQRERSELMQTKLHSLDHRNKVDSVQLGAVTDKLETYIRDNTASNAETRQQLEQAMQAVSDTVAQVGETVARVESSVVRSDRTNPEGLDR